MEGWSWDGKGLDGDSRQRKEGGEAEDGTGERGVGEGLRHGSLAD